MVEVRRPLDDDEIRRLADALAVWATRHPAPLRPVVSFTGEAFLSPAELVAAVRERTEEGRAFLHMIEVNLAEMPEQEDGHVTLDDVIQGFEQRL